MTPEEAQAMTEERWRRLAQGSLMGGAVWMVRICGVDVRALSSVESIREAMLGYEALQAMV